jgi:hypothetical protein
MASDHGSLRIVSPEIAGVGVGNCGMQGIATAFFANEDASIEIIIEKKYT